MKISCDYCGNTYKGKQHPDPMMMNVCPSCEVEEIYMFNDYSGPYTSNAYLRPTNPEYYLCVRNTVYHHDRLYNKL